MMGAKNLLDDFNAAPISISQEDQMINFVRSIGLDPLLTGKLIE
jgi:hypothetical protein